MNLESCWEDAKALCSEPWYFPSLFPHSQSAHRHTKWRPSPPLTARMENLSLASMGDPSLVYGDTRGTNKALFPFCHKHASQRQNHLDQASSLICPTRPAVPPSVCRLGTEGYPGLHVSPTNSPVTHTGWGADPSSLPWKALYYMHSLCRGAKSWKAIEIPKEFAFPRDSLKSFILKAVHTGEGPSAFANKKLVS